MQARGAAMFGRLPPHLRRAVLHRLGRFAPWEDGFDFTPPELLPGEVDGPPDFVGIGAQKAGTTWWYHQIRSHPAVYARPGIHKERHFFDRFGTDPFSEAEAARYRGWFPRRPGTVTGEWTPDYLPSPWVPTLLHRSAPDAKLLLLLRDPVERFRSGLAHDRRMGSTDRNASVADAVRRGFAHDDLDRWLSVFDAGSLLVLQYERCVADPVGQLQATFEFLGLDPFTPAGLTGRHSSGAGAGTRTDTGAHDALDPEVRARLVSLYEDDVVALSERLAELDLSLWPNFAHLCDGPHSGGANSPIART